ncbi:MAG: hypothetical protein AAFW67_07890 [Cyanobacteria bacterium J06638_38]
MSETNFRVYRFERRSQQVFAIEHGNSSTYSSHCTKVLVLQVANELQSKRNSRCLLSD